jgi:16S rRNA (cytosine1402-N4)-methyltransferase
LLGLDQDPIVLPKTEARLRALGFGPEVFTVHRSNFAGLPRVLAGEIGARLVPTDQPQHIEHVENAAAGVSHTAALRSGADIILADLGVSSMQLDDPARGFSTKFVGPLDMRMNPQRGESAGALLARIKPAALGNLLEENADEPEAARLATGLAGKEFATTLALARAIRAALPNQKREATDLTVRRVFQALRIAVNDEFSALETFLRNLPSCLNPSGRVAVLTFHSGEDRRVKKAFEAGLREGGYADIAHEVIRPTPAERHANPRSSSAKLRWARKA